MPTAMTAFPIPLAVSLPPHPRARPAGPLLGHTFEAEMRRRRARGSGAGPFPVGRAHLPFPTTTPIGVVPLEVNRGNESVLFRVGTDDRLSSCVHLSGRGRQFGPQPGEQVGRKRLSSIIDWSVLDDNPRSGPRTALPLGIAVLSRLECGGRRRCLKLRRLVTRVGAGIGKIYRGRRGSGGVGGE